jgi:hypothetical protein
MFDYQHATPELVVNGRLLPIVKWLSDPHDVHPRLDSSGGPYEEIGFIVDRPEPPDLFMLGNTISIDVGEHFSGVYRVVKVEERYVSLPASHAVQRVFAINLARGSLTDSGEMASDDSIEVLHRTAFMSVRANTLVRALAELLQAKGTITPNELWQQFAATARSSFRDLALNVVAESEASAMTNDIVAGIEEHLQHPDELAVSP